MAWMLYMLQRRIKMNFGTLLGLISGGKYQTSDDLPPLKTSDSPPLREQAHSFMDDLIQKQEAEMSKVLYPASKNIFGQPTKPITQEDLNNLAMGLVSPGQGASGALFGKAGREKMQPLINKITKDIERMDRTIERNYGWVKNAKRPEFKENITRITEEVINDKFLYRRLLNYLNRYGEGINPKQFKTVSNIAHYVDSIYDQGNLVAKKLKQGTKQYK